MLVVFFFPDYSGLEVFFSFVPEDADGRVFFVFVFCCRKKVLASQKCCKWMAYGQALEAQVVLYVIDSDDSFQSLLLDMNVPQPRFSFRGSNKHVYSALILSIHPLFCLWVVD